MSNSNSLVEHIKREGKNGARYNIACEQGLARTTKAADFNAEAIEGFKAGLNVAEGSEPLFRYMQRIKSETNFAFSFISGMLCRLEALKGKSYLASWMKRGYSGIKANLDRKWDRLEIVFECIQTNSVPTAGDNAVQAATDLIVYLQKFSILLHEESPEQFEKWLNEIVSFQEPDDRPSEKKIFGDHQVTDSATDLPYDKQPDSTL